MTRSLVYLPPDAAARLRRYTYHGEDRSYVYTYVWRPLCRRLVQHLPRWLSPNVITVTALLCVCVTHALLAYYMPYLSVPTHTSSSQRYDDDNDHGATRTHISTSTTTDDHVAQPPPAIFVAAACALLVYQLLDNLDGHQARRLGVASPLGLLVDHGCDAFNCIVGGLSAAAAIGAGPCWRTWCVVLNTLFVFVFNTWESYYRGALILPVVNGANEGLLLNVLVYLWTAWCGGPAWWQTHSVVVPRAWLPRVLQQRGVDAAATVEAALLSTLCPRTPWSCDDVAAAASARGSRTATACAASNGSGARVVSYLHDAVANVLAFVHVDCTRSRDRDDALQHTTQSRTSVVQRAVLKLYADANSSVIDVRYNTLFVLFMTLLAAVTCIGNVYQVYKAVHYQQQEDEEQDTGVEHEHKAHDRGNMAREQARRASSANGHTTHNGHDATTTALARQQQRRQPPRRRRRRWPLLHALTRLTPLIVITLMANVWYLTTQENIFRRHPRLFTWTVGLLYTKLSIHIMVAHLCGIAFQPYRRTFLPFVLFGAHIAATYVHSRKTRLDRIASRQRAHMPHADSVVVGVSSSSSSEVTLLVDEELMLYEFFALSVVTFAHLVWHLTRDMMYVLRVPLFTVPTLQSLPPIERTHGSNDDKDDGNDDDDNDSIATAAKPKMA